MYTDEDYVHYTTFACLQVGLKKSLKCSMLKQIYSLRYHIKTKHLSVIIFGRKSGQKKKFEIETFPIYQ